MTNQPHAAEKQEQVANTVDAHVGHPWVNHEFDPQEPCCVRCGCSLFLKEGCEWDEVEAFNMCDECTAMTLKEVVANRPLEQAREPRTAPSGCSAARGDTR